jgi:hypothetical protein
MKFFLVTAVMIFALSSCQDKNMQLISKKWDCVKIDNLDPIDKRSFSSPSDSIAASRIETALKELNWTFNTDHTYQCSIGDKTVTRGTYELADNARTLICTTLSKNTVNRYTISTLTDDEMVLNNQVTNVNLILHFKAH